MGQLKREVGRFSLTGPHPDARDMREKLGLHIKSFIPALCDCMGEMEGVPVTAAMRAFIDVLKRPD